FEYLDAPETLLADSLRHRSLVWTRNGHGLVGFGTAARLHTHGEERFARARAWFAQVIEQARIIDPISRPGSGLVSFGSFAFSFTSVFESRLVIPQLVIGRDEEKSWITVTGSAEELNGLTYQQALARAESAMADASLPAAETGSIELTSGQLTAGSYLEAVDHALGHFEERGISKLVLARDVLAHSSTPINLARIVDALTEQYG
ncbi:isochorismate synthase, partial [Escherichia coli]|nr:isochorismate synthase [Escherichia coli]